MTIPYPDLVSPADWILQMQGHYARLGHDPMLSNLTPPISASAQSAPRFCSGAVHDSVPGLSIALLQQMAGAFDFGDSAMLSNTMPSSPALAL